MAKNEHPAVAGVKTRQKAMEEQNAAFYEREANVRPTPTQEENDLARVGALNVDKKEDDGSEWETDAHRRVMEGKIDNPYDTRSMEARPTGDAGRSSASERPASGERRDNAPRKKE
jgi:hypothetical protein